MGDWKPWQQQGIPGPMLTYQNLWGLWLQKKMAGHENLTMQRKNCHLNEMKRRASSMLNIKHHDFSSFKESSRILAKHYRVKFKIRFWNQHVLGLKSNSVWISKWNAGHKSKTWPPNYLPLVINGLQIRTWMKNEERSQQSKKTRGRAWVP